LPGQYAPIEKVPSMLFECSPAGATKELALRAVLNRDSRLATQFAHKHHLRLLHFRLSGYLLK